MTRVGIVGGGQLGRMLALAGPPLGITCTTLDPGERTSASQVAPAIRGDYDDREALARLLEVSDVVTYEFENVPVDAAAWVAERRPIHPPPRSLEAAQDRLAEKRLFEQVGLDVPPYAPVGSLDELTAALGTIGVPAVLKTRRLGYDGKGQAVIHVVGRAEDAWRAVGEVPCLLESFVSFDRELSIVAARGEDGAVGAYPLVENLHRDGILRLTVAPAASVDPEVASRADAHVRALMTALGHVGVLAVELFERDGELLGNEMAPRVHNSGHWTIEGAETSQFEQHLRAITGLPLGPADAVGCSAMVNLIGTIPATAAVAAVAGAHLHLYGKEPRPGRKVGHITVWAPDRAELKARALQLAPALDDAVVERPWPI